MMKNKVHLDCLLFVLIIGNFVGFLSCLSVEEELKLTYAEKTALDKFKLYVENEPLVTQSYMRNDIYLIKWLRVGKLDAARSKDLFKTHLKWRKDNKIDSILREDFSALKESFPISLDGEDKTGRPIIAASANFWDVRRGVLSGLLDKVTRYVYYAIEFQSQKIRDKQQLGQNVTQFQVILDLSGYNVVQHGCISVYVDFIRSFIYRYPYMADSLIFVNTPPIFEVILDALNLRRAKTVRIKVFGLNKNEWKKFLLQEVSEDQLATFLGGTLDSDIL